MSRTRSLFYRSHTNWNQTISLLLLISNKARPPVQKAETTLIQIVARELLLN